MRWDFQRYQQRKTILLQGHSPKRLMYAVVFAIPTITILATDIAIYLKVVRVFNPFPNICLQLKAMQNADVRMSITTTDEREMEKVGPASRSINLHPPPEVPQNARQYPLHLLCHLPPWSHCQVGEHVRLQLFFFLKTCFCLRLTPATTGRLSTRWLMSSIGLLFGSTRSST